MRFYDTGRDAGLRDELEALAEELDLGDHVLFTGYEADNRRVMQGLDLLVSAATAPESFGRVLVEAQACGVPVVASAQGGSLEIVEDRITGRLFRPRDAEAMAVRAVRSVIEDSTMREACIAAARESVEARFTVGSYVAGVVRTYDRIFEAAETAGPDSDAVSQTSA